MMDTLIVSGMETAVKELNSQSTQVKGFLSDVSSSIYPINETNHDRLSESDNALMDPLGFVENMSRHDTSGGLKMIFLFIVKTIIMWCCISQSCFE